MTDGPLAGQTDLVGLLARRRVVGIIRARDAPAAVAAGRTLLDNGVSLVEVSLTTPGALDAIAALARVAGGVVGAGTVLTEQDARDVSAAGARFVVTPALTPGIEEAVGLGLPVLAGAQTASEALEALARGAAAVKLFPASLGGPGYLKALRDPFPTVPFVPVGGIDLALAREYLRVGALGVGIGGPLVGDAATGGSLEALAGRAASFAGLAREFA